MAPRARRKSRAAESRPPRAPRAWPRAALIGLAVVLVYANSLSGPFVFDDELAIVENRTIRSLDTAVHQQPDSPLAGRPVVALSFAMNYALSGLDAASYHGGNIAIHAVNALLFFALLRRTLKLRGVDPWLASHGDDLALAIVLLWALHPINSEAVDYITQRTESLMAFFFLLTVYASLRSAGGRTEAAWQGLAIAACALGMACKESMAAVPLIVLLYDRIFLADSFREALEERYRLYTGLALCWLLLAALNISGPRSGSAGFGTFSPWTYLLNQTVLIVRYLRLAVWPTDLVLHYGLPLPLTLSQVWLPFTLLTLLAAAVLLAFRYSLPAGFLGAWFFITLAPASSIVPIATEVGAERRMYLPMMAVVSLAVLGIPSVRSLRERISRPAALGAVAIAAILLGGLTISRNREYESGLLLAQTSLDRWPTDYAHGVLGSELMHEQRDADALEHLRIGARVNPRARYNLGVALFNLKRFDEARAELKQLVTKYPWREEAPWSHRIIGHTYLVQGTYPEAIAEFRMVLAMTPGDRGTIALLVEALGRQGIALGTAGDHGQAIKAFRAALALDPKNGQVQHNLATTLLDAGDLSGGVAAAREAVAMEPNAASSQNVLGRALAMQGKYDEALPHLQAAVKLRPEDPQLQEDLQRVLEARK